MYNLALGIFFTSRDVVFCENEFPFAEITSRHSLLDAGILSNSSFVDLFDDDDLCQHVPIVAGPSSSLANETIPFDDHPVTCESAPGSCSIESPNVMQSAVEAKWDSLQ